MREKSEKSKSAWLSWKYVTNKLNFFHIQFEVPRVKSRQFFFFFYSLEEPQFLNLLWAFCQDLELQVAVTGRKKTALGQKKAANNFFDVNHHFESHKMGFKNFDQQSDIPKRCL